MPRLAPVINTVGDGACAASAPDAATARPTADVASTERRLMVMKSSPNGGGMIVTPVPGAKTVSRPATRWSKLVALHRVHHLLRGIQVVRRALGVVAGRILLHVFVIHRLIEVPGHRRLAMGAAILR